MGGEIGKHAAFKLQSLGLWVRVPPQVHKSRYRITVITSDFQSEDLGSIPGTCSNGVVAQLAERYPCKVEDVGSNPIYSTMSNTMASC